MPYPGEEYARMFQRHRAPLPELLDQLPAEHADTAPWEGGMSFKQTADHLFSTGTGVVEMLSGIWRGRSLPPRLRTP